MKRPHQDMILKRLDMHVADRAEGGPSVGSEPMNQPFALHPRVELLLDGDKNLWIDGFEFQGRLIGDVSQAG